MISFSCFSGSCFGDMTQSEEEMQGLQNKVDMSDDCKNSQKITGYLEKRGKLRLMNMWKRYWFVLEGHLLLYYGSKEDYDALSPCKGSITLGPTCIVKPYASTPSKFQITTRSGSVITLKAESISEQNKWMQAICTTVNENQKIDISPSKLCHFRYSTERVDMLLNNVETTQKQNNSPGPSEPEPPPSKTTEKGEEQLLGRLQKMGARSYCDSIIFDNQKSITKKPIPKNLDKKVLINENISGFKDTGIASPRKLQFSPKIPKIKEEPATTKEEVVFEDEDYCVCTLDKKEDTEVPKSTQNSTERSISFLEAREVFNKNLQSASRPNKSPVPQKIQIPNARKDNSKLEDNEENARKITEDKKPEETFSQNAICEDQEKPKEISNYSDSTKTSETITSDTSLAKDAKQPSLISLLGSFYNIEENELYSEYDDKPEFQPNEDLYSEPKMFEDTSNRRNSPEFQFPPPPCEVYESIVDLTSDIQNQDDEDSLYEEAEDFVWLNEIYESSSCQNEYSSSSQGKQETQFNKENVEIENDLYEEVDESFVYKKSPTEEENRDEELYTEPYFHKGFGKSRHVSEDSEIYEVVDVQQQQSFKIHDDAGVEQIENELYGETNKNTYRDSEKNSDDGKIHRQFPQGNKLCYDKKTDSSEVNIENNLYVDPTLMQKDLMYAKVNKDKNKKEIEMENEIYAVSNPMPNTEPCQLNIEKNHSTVEELEIENEIYAEPHINSQKYEKQLSEKSVFETKSTFSRQSSRKEKDFPNKMNQQGDVQIPNDLYESMYLENEIYAEPNIHPKPEGASNSFQANLLESDREKMSIKDDDDEHNNVYEDPDQLRMRPQKVDKGKKLQKGQELKKHNNFIQRLLKQVTRKHGEKSDKGTDSCDNADETLALLADIQALLEKKKQIIKQMVSKSPKSSHRRIVSETNAHLGKNDKSGFSPSPRRLSIDLNEEYCVVRDSLEDDDEVIYSEVEIIDRSSKELKEIIDDLLKRYKNSDQEDCGGNS